MTEPNAQVILKVAQAIGAHLELSDVLESLIATLNPIVHFDAVAIAILEGEAIRVQSAHAEGIARKAGESVSSLVARYASDTKSEPPPIKMPASDHPISEIMKSREPYIASDLTTERPSAHQAGRAYRHHQISVEGKRQLHGRAGASVAGRGRHGIAGGGKRPGL
jgi:hypothetical protein